MGYTLKMTRPHQGALPLVLVLVCLLILPWAAASTGGPAPSPTETTSQPMTILHSTTGCSGSTHPTRTMFATPPPGSGTYNEDFTTTTYRDATPTNATGWGTGTIQLPRKTLTLAGSYNTPEEAFGVFVSGDFAYVADAWGGLRVVNISDPTSPTSAGVYNTPGEAFGVFVSGDYCYVADYDQGLRVVNITDPTSPTSVGVYNTPGEAWDVFVSGDYCYVADSTSGLRVVNITDPTSPTSVGVYNTPGQARGVFVSGDYCYVADYNQGFRVVNISDPTSPTSVGVYDTTDVALAVFVSGDYCYVAEGSVGMRVVNIFDPTSPTSAGVYNNPDYARDVFVSGGYCYVADWVSGLQVVKIADPVSPTSAGSYDTPGYAYGVFVSGDYAYVADSISGLRVVDISDPTSPSSAGVYDTPGNAEDVFVAGDYAYVADGAQGLRVVNITDPTSASSAGVYDTPGYARGVFVAGDYAYVADGAQGLRVVNITDPTSPTEVGSYDTPSYAFDVFVWGDYAYVADFGSGLQVVNITDPTSPSSAGVYDTPGDAYDVFVSGDYAYVADGYSGLRVVDISNPTSPSSAGVYGPPSQAESVFVAGDYAYVANYDKGLRVVNITDPTSPTSAGFYDTPGYAWGVFVSGDYAYVADYDYGLRVVEVQKNRCRQYQGLAVAQSTPIYSGSATVLRATLTATQTTPTDTTITYNLSADDGAHWEQVTSGVEHIFTNTGKQLKWKGVLTTTNVTVTPQISSLSITYTTKLDAPSLTSPGDGTNTNDDTPDFSWSSVTGAASYLLQLDTVSSFDSGSLRNCTPVSSPYTPSPALADGTWYWRVAANDSEGDLGFFSGIRSLDIETTDPTWDEPLTNQVVEYCTGLSYDVNASDPSGIHTYWVNDTTHFTIDVDGVITNASTPFPVDIYWLEINVNDTLGNTLTTSISITVQDTTDPTWDETPTDQVVEYCTGLSYDVNASDHSGIDDYWVNNTATFTINDITGIITNITSLPVGTYWLEVRAYDPYGQYCSAIFKVTVQDTTDPDWDEPPANQVVEYCSGLSYDVDASDHSGVTYWINDTVTFGVDAAGVITNVTALPVGVYWLEVRAYDPYSQYCSAIFKVTVEDTTDPAWDQTPIDQFVEFCSGFSYDLDASDHSGVTYWVNDTATFAINSAGVITNITALPVGVYWLEVRSYDPYTNYCTATIKITVVDTTDPVWASTITDTSLDYEEALDLQLQATDHSGIAQWSINDTTHFAIDATGHLTSVGTLDPGTYGLTVTAHDPYGNSCSVTVTITVGAAPPPPIPGFPLGAIALGVVAALGLGIVSRRSRRRSKGSG